MPLNELAVPERITGVRQIRRKLEAQALKKLFIARDADNALVAPIEAEARRQGIPVEWADDMIRLGRACAISRGASVAGICRSGADRTQEKEKTEGGN
ncbi:MAG: 50S ribosomal protein L7ae [Synergistaceae bacterium]|nr:50S ribosomal protein L7ae [Synergistaceae bacterium]